MVAPVYAAETAVGKELRDRARRDGLKSALAWRRSQFDQQRGPAERASPGLVAQRIQAFAAPASSAAR